MTVIKQLRFGETAQVRELVDNRGLLSTQQITTARPASPPIQVSRHARNGKHPNAVLESMKSEAANAACMFKGKEIFRSIGTFPATLANTGFTAGSGTVGRWRSYFHTSPIALYIDVTTQARTNQVFSTSASFVQVDLTEVATSIVTTETLPTGGLNATGSLLTIFQFITKRMSVKPDTDYHIAFTDVNTESVFAHVVELCSLTVFNGGYLPQNIAAQGAILNGYRQNAAELVAAMWNHGGWPLWNWCIEDGTKPPSTTAPTGLTNVVEALVSGGVTTLGSNRWAQGTLGAVIDTTGRARRMELKGGISATLAVYTNGAVNVQLFNSKGLVGGDVVSSGGFQWHLIQAIALPGGTIDKYDLMFAADSGTASIYAASLFEYTP